MAALPVKAWICPICGYIHYGPEPPDECPVCGTPGDQFEPYTGASPAPAAPEMPQPEPVVTPALKVVIISFVFRGEAANRVLAGATLLGDTRHAAKVKRAVENKLDYAQLLQRQPGAAEILEYL